MSTSPDRLFHMGGAPVSGNPYLGMWGESTYFVDYDNGTTGGSGKTPASASKHLETAISNADANDVIYVRPRTPATTSWDPNYIIPSSTSNWTIPYTKHGLAIIGTGYGRGQGSQFYTYLRGTGTATATPALDINAPWTLIENLSFHDGSRRWSVRYVWICYGQYRFKLYVQIFRPKFPKDRQCLVDDCTELYVP